MSHNAVFRISPEEGVLGKPLKQPFGFNPLNQFPEDEGRQRKLSDNLIQILEFVWGMSSQIPIQQRSSAFHPSTSSMKPSKNVEMDMMRSRRARLEALTATLRLPPLTPDNVKTNGRPPSKLQSGASRRYGGGGGAMIDHYYRRIRGHERSAGTSRGQSASIKMQLGPTKLPTLGIAPMTPYHNPLPSIGQQRVQEDDAKSILPDANVDSPPPPSYESTMQNGAVTSRDNDRPESAKSLKTSDDDVKDSRESSVKDSENPNHKDIVARMSNDDLEVRIKATREARLHLSKELVPNFRDFLEAGVIKPAIESLRIENVDLQFEALWVLTNIASGTSEDTKAVVDNDALPFIIGLLRSPHENIQEQSLWALGNISGDCHEYRNKVLQHGVMEPLQDFIHQDKKLSFSRNLAWLMSNLCRHKPLDYEEEDRGKILKIIQHLMKSDDTEVLTDSLWSLSYISDDNLQGIQKVIDGQVVPRVVECLNHEAQKISKPALRICGNIATGDDTQTEYLLNQNILGYLPKFLKSDSDVLRKEVSWLLSNITAGTNQQIQMVIDAELLPELVKMANEDVFEVRKEATWVLSNLTAGGEFDQLKTLIKEGGIQAMLRILDKMVEGMILKVALEAILNLLQGTERDPETLDEVKSIIEHNEGLDLLETHAHSNVEDVAKIVNDILNKYFHDGGDSVDEGINMMTSDEGSFVVEEDKQDQDTIEVPKEPEDVNGSKVSVLAMKYKPLDGTSENTNENEEPKDG